MNILVVGDIVGSLGIKIFASVLSNLKDKFKIDFTIANAENTAGGLGITTAQANQLFRAGVNVLTSGNHVWKKREIMDYLVIHDNLLRPANYPEGAPGRGSCVVEVSKYISVGVINILGRVFMEPLCCPFRAADKIIEKIRSRTKIIIVDFHAEATSEKVAMGRYLDGRVSAVVGTHTHVQTADEKILEGGTAYITDLGMTGPHDSIIGIRKELIIDKFLTQLPRKFEVAKGDTRINGAIIKVDVKTGRAKTISRLDIPHSS